MWHFSPLNLFTLHQHTRRHSAKVITIFPLWSCLFCSSLNFLTHTSALGRVLGEWTRCKFYLLLLYCLFPGNRGDNKRVLHLKDTSLWNWKLTFAVGINCKDFELEDCSCGRTNLMSFKYSVSIWPLYSSYRNVLVILCLNLT